MATVIIMPPQDTVSEKVGHRLCTDVLDIDISPPRCASHFRQFLYHPDNEAHVKELRDQIQILINNIKEQEKDTNTDYDIKKKIDTDPQISNLKKQLFEASKSLTRISHEAPIAMAVVMNYMVREILEHAISYSKEENSRFIEIEHISAKGVQRLKTYALFRTLPAFRNSVLAQKNETENDNEELPNIGFGTYIGKALIRIKNQDKFSNTRVRQKFRTQLSNLISECLMYLVKLIHVAMSKFAGIRTISAEHVKSITYLLLTSEGQSEESINEILNEIDVKLQIYRRYKTAIKENKEKQKKELEYQKKEPESDKKLSIESSNNIDEDYPIMEE